MKPLVSLHNVSKTFDNATDALKDFSLDVREGEFLSLVGPSGCGKSTVLRLIAGLLGPTAGSVDYASPRPEMSFVFQEPTLMPWATTLDNTRLPLDLKGVSAQEALRRAREALHRVGLDGFESAYPRELSGGMKMRVSIARAIAGNAKLVLLDEPFAALDELTRQELNDDLLKLWREDGLTIVFVTHSVFESAYLSSRVVVFTPRPGRQASEIVLAPPLARTEEHRLSPAFASDASQISHALRSAMRGAGG